MTMATYGADLAASHGTLYTTAGANNKAAGWSEIVASLAFDAKWCIVQVDHITADCGFLVDIGVGAAASEAVVIADLPFYGNVVPHIRTYCIPVDIAAGSRVAIRAQSSVTTRSMWWVVRFTDDLPTAVEYVETIGANTAASIGTTVDPGATLNTKGAYSELIAATADDIDLLLVAVGQNSIASILTARVYHLIDIAVGAAASESPVVENIMYGQNNLEYVGVASPMYFPVSIPAGSRIAVRTQSDNNTVNTREIDVTIIGLKYIGGGGAGGEIRRHMAPFWN